MLGGWSGGRAIGNQKHTKRVREEKMGHSWLPVGETRQRVFIRRVQDSENKYFTSRESRKGMKAKENEGEGVLPPTEPRGDVAIRSGVQKGENLLNSCRGHDVAREGDEGEERGDEVDGISLK